MKIKKKDTFLKNVSFFTENSEDFLFDWKTIICYGINPFRDWIFI